MDREPPPVTVTAPASSGPPPDLLEGAPRRSRRPRPTAVLALAAVAVLGAAVVRGGGGPAAPSPTGPSPTGPSPTGPSPTGPPPTGPPPTVRTATSGITASASLAGAATDQPDVQRLTLTVDLPPVDGRSDSGGRLLGDEVLLVDVRVRGFSLEPDDQRRAVPLGRFGRSTSGRSTTVPVTAVVDDCSVETQARRDVVLTVRTGERPEGTVRAVADADVVRALDRLVSRTCRRPRG